MLKKKWTEKETALLVQLYNEGRPSKTICAALNRSYASVMAKLTALRMEGRID